MSRFVRQEAPPQFDERGMYLPFLRRDFRYRCAYCERTETFLGGEEFFEIDHLRPVFRSVEFRVSPALAPALCAGLHPADLGQFRFFQNCDATQCKAAGATEPKQNGVLSLLFKAAR